MGNADAALIASRFVRQPMSWYARRWGEAMQAAANETQLAEPVTAALGHDVTPGHDELHHYWTRDPEGLAKWVESPTPWTTLVAHLAKHVSLEKAKAFASKWHKEVFGIWVGEKKGKNPLGPG